MKNLLVIGSSGHARVVVDIIHAMRSFQVVGLIDRYRRIGEAIMGYSILGAEEDLPIIVREYRVDGVAVAIGDNSVRAAVARRVHELCPELQFATLVHPKASVGGGAFLGEGTVMMAGAVVNSGARVGRHCILNTNSSLDHDSVLEDHASLAPQAMTGGACRIGEYSAIGMGAILVHGVQVGAHVVIGAGALVLKDIRPMVVAYGAPAREVRARKPGDPYLGRVGSR